ncbi:SDR family NAD(P)-dependent oxidoreductase [Paenibacillus contaminans]|jgi:3-oxoacyl-[acyl-carrier protein] reductase|uniref:3-oxoacyl-ACP reductase n=1 Tax=Paenibacillus contaminans TaxID=450362 RepID=A0A329MT46_9BACL|nr:SDR family NAD(P)-dependent oxidoreductase [Paenibacillus contaminans]RAV22468.1 3-oxoacyl-ACP reductase [Paenibacillus contaminans]
MRLKGKIAVVTGAGRGIGEAIARKFLQEGATVVICDALKARVEEAAGRLAAFGTVQSFAVDVTNREDVQAMIDETVRIFGRIDILANNAGIARFEPFLEIEDKNWNDTLAVNLTGTFICSQIAARVMAKQKSGAIVNMASTNGILGEEALAHYNASKAGIVLLGKTMAIELAPYGIRVNSICPGSIQTDLALEGGQPAEELEQYFAKIPLKRRGSTEEVANAFAFLASDEASFITGTELVVDGGQICHE